MLDGQLRTTLKNEQLYEQDRIAELTANATITIKVLPMKGLASDRAWLARHRVSGVINGNELELTPPIDLASLRSNGTKQDQGTIRTEDQSFGSFSVQDPTWGFHPIHGENIINRSSLPDEIANAIADTELDTSKDYIVNFTFSDNTNGFKQYLRYDNTATEPTWVLLDDSDEPTTYYEGERLVGDEKINRSIARAKELVKYLIDNGRLNDLRKGMNSISLDEIPGFRFDLEKGDTPILTSSDTIGTDMNFIQFRASKIKGDRHFYSAFLRLLAAHIEQSFNIVEHPHTNGQKVAIRKYNAPNKADPECRIYIELEEK